jgi:hypothetical protein
MLKSIRRFIMRSKRAARAAPWKAASVITLGAIGIFGAAGELKADSIIITPLAPSTSGGTTTYSYQISLAPYTALYTAAAPVGSDAWAPDFFDILDFYGYVNGSASFSASNPGAVFSLAQPLVDPAMSSIYPSNPPADDPNVVNLRAEFMGGELINNSGSNLLLGTLSAKSIYPPNTVLGTFIASTTSPDGNASVTSGGTTIFPDPPQLIPHIPVVPVPAAIWGGLGLMSALGLHKARRARQ